MTIIKIPGGGGRGVYMIVLTGSDGTIRDKSLWKIGSIHLIFIMLEVTIIKISGRGWGGGGIVYDNLCIIMKMA